MHNQLDDLIKELAKSKNDLQVRHLIALGKMFEIPLWLFVDRNYEIAIINKQELELLAMFAYSHDFIGASKVSELLHITIMDVREKDFKQYQVKTNATTS
jgi:hypothetical protein